MAFGLDLGNLLVHLRADASHYDRVMRGAELRMKATAEKLTSLGRTMMMRVTVPLTLLGGASVKAFASFDDAMTKSTAIMSDMTPELRKEMEDLALTLSKEGVKSAKNLAQSYFYLASAGLSAEQSIAALRPVMKFATAGAFDMALATDLITDAQSALGLTMKNAIQNQRNMIRVSDVLIGANTLANATTLQFSSALTSEAGPAMKAYNIALEEGVAVLAAYADQGIKAEHAGSMFGRMLRLMTKGFQSNEEVWKRFNLDIYDATGNLKPLWDIIRDLTGVLDTMSIKQKIATLTMLGFQARSQQAILPILGLGDKIEEYNKKLVEMAGITEKVYRKQLASFAAQMKILWNWIVAASIGIGRILEPSILKMNRGIRIAIGEWDKLKGSVQKNIIIFGLIAAAIGPVLLMTGLLIKTFAFLITTVKVLVAWFAGLTALAISPFGFWIASALLLAAIAYTLRAAWEQNLMVIKNRLEWFFGLFKIGYDWLSKTVGSFLTWMVPEWKRAIDAVGERWDNFLYDIAGIYGAVKALIKGEDWASGFMEARDAAMAAVEELEHVVKKGYETTVLYLRAFGEATVEHLQDLVGVLKVQFGRDADALINLIKNKVKLLQETAGVLKPSDVDELIAKYEELVGKTAGAMAAITKVGDVKVGFTGFREAWTGLAQSLRPEEKTQEGILENTGDMLDELKTQTGYLKDVGTVGR